MKTNATITGIINSTMERLRDIQAILCDWDDTKVSTFRSCVDLFNNFAKTAQLTSRTVEEIMPHWGKPIHNIIAGLWPDAEKEALENRFWTYVDLTDFTIKPFPNTREAIVKLKEMGYVLGIVSSSSKKVVDKTLTRHLNLPPDTYLFIQTSEDTPVHKPNPKVFDPAFDKLKKFGISEDQTIYVGDGLIDYQAAKARDILFVAVTTGFTTAEQFMKNGLEKNLILVSFDQLPSILASDKK